MTRKSPHPRAGEGSCTPCTPLPQARTRLLLLDLLEFRFDDVLLVLRLAVPAGVLAGCRAARRGARTLLGSFRVHRLGQLVRRACERVRRTADLIGVLGFERFLRVGERALDAALR